MIIQGKSGTGKTVAVLVGMLQNIDQAIDRCQAIVIEPTHELADQTTRFINTIGQFMDIKCRTFIGGRLVFDDVERVCSGINIAVATVGRLFHLLEDNILG